jgi:hypothetical protein
VGSTNTVPKVEPHVAFELDPAVPQIPHAERVEGILEDAGDLGSSCALVDPSRSARLSA